MREEPESVVAFRVGATLATLAITYGVLSIVLAVTLSDDLKSTINMSTGAGIAGGLGLLVVGGLMAERAAAARGQEDTPPAE